MMTFPFKGRPGGIKDRVQERGVMVEDADDPSYPADLWMGGQPTARITKRPHNFPSLNGP